MPVVSLHLERDLHKAGFIDMFYNFRWHMVIPCLNSETSVIQGTVYCFSSKRKWTICDKILITKAESVYENQVHKCIGANALKHWLVFVNKIKTCLMLCLSLNGTVSLIFTFISVGCVHGIWAWKVSRSVTTIVKCYSLIFLLLIWSDFYFGYTFIISKGPLWDIVSFDSSDADRTCQEATGVERWTINDR